MAKEVKAWKPLNKNDVIAVVYPSHRPGYKGNRETPVGTPVTEIKHVKGWVAALGLTLFESDFLAQFLLTERDWEVKAGGAKIRAQLIFNALNNPKVKAIYAYGGHGADETILELDKLFKKHGLPKRGDALPLIGFSDATQLQLYLGEMGLVSPIQIACNEATSEVGKLLFKQVLPQQIPLIPINDAARVTPKISGKAIGGHDFAVCWASRTSHRLQTGVDRNNILLLEGMRTYNFYKALKMLESQGQLANVQAIVLGKCYGNNGSERLEECDVKAVVKELANLKILEKIPVFFGAPFGHTKGVRPVGFLPIPLNTETTIETNDNKSSISFDSVRKMVDIKQAKAAYASRKPWMPAHESKTYDEVKDGSDFRAATSTMHQPIELHPLHHLSTKIPTSFIGCSIVGTDIPAIEGRDLSEKNLLLNIDLGGAIDIGQVGGFWGLAQKATISMMQLKYMHQDKILGSITISTQIPLPKNLTIYLKQFTEEHFPEKPVFTAMIPRDTEICKELSKYARISPLLVKLKTHTKARDLDAEISTQLAESANQGQGFIQRVQLRARSI